MKKFLKISIVIPTLNRHESLVNTINSILSFESVPNQIIIVDQSNNEIAKKNSSYFDKFFPNQILHKIVDFKSLTKARNVGVELAKNEIIIFSDDDVEVYEDTLGNIDKIMEDKKVALLAAVDTIKNHNKESLFPYLYFYKNPFKLFIGHVSLSMTGHFPYKMKNNFIKTEWAMGFFFIIRKSLFNKFGIEFDENLTDYGYGEDLDFSLRYINLSNQLLLDSWLCKYIKVKHLVSNEFRIPNENAVRKFYFARLYMIFKNRLKISSLIHYYFFNFFNLFKFLLKPKIFIVHLKYILLTIPRFNLIKRGKL
jgi:GT2 family glycosyltransferase